MGWGGGRDGQCMAAAASERGPREEVGWMGLTDESLHGRSSDGRMVDMVKWMNQKLQVWILCLSRYP